MNRVQPRDPVSWLGRGPTGRPGTLTADILGSIGRGAGFLNQVNEDADAARAPDRTGRSTEEQILIKLMIMAGRMRSSSAIGVAKLGNGISTDYRTMWCENPDTAGRGYSPI